MEEVLEYNKKSFIVYSRFSFKVENPWLTQLTLNIEKEKEKNSLCSVISFLFAFFLLMVKQKGCYLTLCIIDYQDINWNEK